MQHHLNTVAIENYQLNPDEPSNRQKVPAAFLYVKQKETYVKVKRNNYLFRYIFININIVFTFFLQGKSAIP